MKNIIYIIFLLIISIKQYAQDSITNSNEIKISSVIKNYFNLERESIHLHLNKKVYINNETIWIKGYVKNRETDLLNFRTNNINAILFDENGYKLSEKLFFCSNGSFAGDFDLNENFKTGDYYIQVYTNWMNNFNEDESTIRKIEIINPNEGIWEKNNKINTNALFIEINPEGKNMIEGITNSIGLNIKDCSGIPAENIEGFLEDNKGEIIKTIKVNKFGHSKFELTPRNEIYKVKFFIEGKFIEQILPMPIRNGIGIEVNNYTLPKKTIVKIRTNKSTIKTLEGKKIYLVMNQDSKTFIKDILINENQLTQELIISNEIFPEGIVTFRIIDSNLTQWSERLVYYFQNQKLESNIIANRVNSEINVSGYSNYNDAILSFSILPNESTGVDHDYTIKSTFLANCYLLNPIKNYNYFITETSRMKLYELDLILLNTNDFKYNWDNIKNKKPIAKFDFEKGIKIKGTLITKFKNIENYKAKLYSIKDMILSTVPIDENYHFTFENIAVADSTKVNISVLKMPDLKPVEAKVVIQIADKNIPFKFLFTKPNLNCIPEKKLVPIKLDELSTLNNEIINLENVTIVKEKNILKHQNSLSNSMLKGYKIDDSFAFQDILYFIESKGFIVNRTGATLEILSRQVTSFSGNRTSPSVFINERLLFSYDELSLIRMTDIDEIYIDRRATIGNMFNAEGIIKIYLKDSYSQKRNLTDTEYIIEKGFNKFKRFKNMKYTNIYSKGFKNYGVIGWSPQIITDYDGQFKFSFTNYNLTNYKLIIEGITNDGQLIFDEKSVNLN